MPVAQPRKVPFNGIMKTFEVSNATVAGLMSTLIPAGILEYQNVVFSGHELCKGVFTGGKVAVPDDYISFPNEGFILSSGSAEKLKHQDNDDTMTQWGLPGDEDLRQPHGDPNLTLHDACTLTFEFRCLNNNQGSLSLGFVFGSDEYKEYAKDDYIDTFGILLNGHNAATIPGSTQNITINTVNHLVNSEYFVSNGPATHDAFVDYPLLEADGFTTKMHANSSFSSGWNTLKLGISDAFDEKYDSWVLFEKGSLDSHTFICEPVATPDELDEPIPDDSPLPDKPLPDEIPPPPKPDLDSPFDEVPPETCTGSACGGKNIFCQTLC